MTTKTLIKRMHRIEQELEAREQRVDEQARVRAATSDTLTWVTEYTQTYNEHCVRPSAASCFRP
jgi:predicted secreted Zn-dependent protease